MDIINRDDLERGGFAGLKETRLVMDPRVFNGRANAGTWSGLGNFVFLADSNYVPGGQTGLHGHKEIDVISVMVDGRIAHEGSLEHGQELSGSMVQVQRAGGEGFEHNEINPDEHENRMIQLWVLPESAGAPAGYKLYETDVGKSVRIYGGDTDQQTAYPSNTLIDVSRLATGQSIEVAAETLVYVTVGGGLVNGQTAREGDMISADRLRFEATEVSHLIVIHIAADHPPQIHHT